MIGFELLLLLFLNPRKTRVGKINKNTKKFELVTKPSCNKTKLNRKSETEIGLLLSLLSRPTFIFRKVAQCCKCTKSAAGDIDVILA